MKLSIHLITSLGVLFLFSCTKLDNYFLFLGNFTKIDDYDFSEKFSSFHYDEWRMITLPTPEISTDALWIKGEGISDTTLSKKVILFFNGNDGYLEGSSTVGLYLRKFGTDFFSFDFRGYGRSAGSFKTTEQSCYDDGATALEYLQDSLKYSLQDIILVGYSMGGGVAVELANRYEVSALVLMSTFTTMDNMVEAVGGGYNIPGNWVLNSVFDNYSKIDKINIPVFITHGEEDMFIDPEHSRRLFEKANSPKFLYVIKGVGHPRFPVNGFDYYFDPLEKFLIQNCR